MRSDFFAAAIASRIGWAESSGRTISERDIRVSLLLLYSGVRSGAGRTGRDKARHKTRSRATSSSCVPSSKTTPSLRTRILSESRIVLNRCAMVITVRPFMSRSRASITSFSDSVSSAAVGSSRIRIGALRMIARAMPMRCRWPPESVRPRSPTRES